jgi:tetratricopeptide (TPR) repeat protein
MIEQGQEARHLEPVRDSERRWDKQAILEILGAGDVDTADTTLTVLHKVAPDALEALPYYQQALSHPDAEVRDMAATMLPGIGHRSQTDVEYVEELVRKDPEYLAARIALLDFYFLMPSHFASARQSRRDHILWIIANRPRCAILGMPFGFLSSVGDEDAYQQGRQLWLDHLQRAPNDLALLSLASHWFFQIDADLSEGFLKRGQQLDDDPKWPKQLGFLYRLSANQRGVIDQEKMRRAVAEYEKALSREGPDDDQRHLRLQLAEACLMLGEFDKADSYAQHVEERSSAGNDYFDSEFLHESRLLLGKNALGRGDVDRAKAFLVKAADVTSKGLRVSGPYMRLAKRLLEKGEKEAVLEYLRKCATVWTMPNHEIDQWIHTIEAGGMPDFGPVALTH